MIKLQAEKYCQVTGKPCILHVDCASCPVVEETQFSCSRCGEKWNLLSDPSAETDTCPECGITVKSDSPGSKQDDGKYESDWDEERGKYR